MLPPAQAKRIRWRLDQLGWRDKQLAEQIGKSAPEMSKILAGERKIDAELAWRMARALGLTEVYVLYGDRRGLPDEIVKALPPD